MTYPLTRHVGQPAVSGLMALGAVEQHARQARQLANLAQLTGRAEEDIAREFLAQWLAWADFYRVKLWELKRRKRDT